MPDVPSSFMPAGASHDAPSGAAAPSVTRAGLPTRFCCCDGSLPATRFSVPHGAGVAAGAAAAGRPVATAMNARTVQVKVVRVR